MAFTRTLPRGILRPPLEPIRASMTDEGMEQLVESLKAVGQLYPLVVKPLGDGPACKAAVTTEGELDRFIKAGNNFEIIDGHRRWIAAERAGVDFLECKIVDPAQVPAHAAMLHANIMREDMTPAEEGWQFLELAQKYAWSLNELISTFRVSENYINERVELVQKDDAVAQAVHTREINLSQAHELLREKDPARRHDRLLLTIEHGYNCKELRVMRQNLESERATMQGELMPHTPQFAPAPDPAAPRVCVWCKQGHDPENLRQVDVHWYHQPELLAVVEQVGVHNVLTAQQEKAPAEAPPADGKGAGA